ncbi:hypothetical protein ACFL1I_06690 [Candidatus Omnitrophota bacterium]
MRERQEREKKKIAAVTIMIIIGMSILPMLNIFALFLNKLQGRMEVKLAEIYETTYESYLDKAKESGELPDALKDKVSEGQLSAIKEAISGGR